MAYEDYLVHHGIKGQKWGVRRFQNPDGTWTTEGLERRRSDNRVKRAGKTLDDVENIIKSLNRKDKDTLGLYDDGGYLTYEQGSHVLKRILEKHGDTPIAFFDMLDDGDNINVVIGTRSGDEYRGKGYATKVAKKGMDWLEKHKDKLSQQKIVWGVVEDNYGSTKIAEKLGFTKDENSRDFDGRYTWVNYQKQLKD